MPKLNGVYEKWVILICVMPVWPLIYDAYDQLYLIIITAVVSFGGVSREQKEEAENFGLVIYAWDEFLKLVWDLSFAFPEQLYWFCDISFQYSYNYAYHLVTFHCEYFCQGEGKQYDLPIKKKSDICTIMYTSGTTGDPKGVMISNESIVTLIAGVIRLLKSANEAVSFLPAFMQFFMIYKEAVIFKFPLYLALVLMHFLFCCANQ